MPEWTPQQQLAVSTRDVSVVLSAGAGCGKTSVLTQRYVRHLEDDGVTPCQIVALTFTERAAREMRDRIRGELRRRWLQSRHSGQLQEARHWRNHLRQLEQAPITTIHSFCATLLRRSAWAAGLDPAFSVLDELQAATLRQEHVRATLDRLLLHAEGTPVAGDLQQLLLWFSYSELQRGLDEWLQQQDRYGWEQWLQQTPEQVAARWRQLCAQVRCRWVQHLRQTHPDWVAVERLLPRLANASPPLAQLAAQLRQQLHALPGAADWNAHLQQLKETATIQRLPRNAWPDDTLREQTRDAFERFRRSLPAQSEPFDHALWQDQQIEQAAQVSQQWLRLALYTANEFARRKREQDLLDFQDLLVECRDLLRQDDRLRRQLQREFRFLLLDELQDTDPVQMELVELLCGEELTSGKLFAVGDHKQSIYRFRGAEVELFLQLRQRVPPQGRLELSCNFRSHPGILRFVNALFAEHLEQYVPLEAGRTVADGEATPVEFLWVAPPDEEAEPETDSDGPAVRRRRWEAAALASRIQELLSDPTPRCWGREQQPRRLRPGDIVLLFRSMTHASIYEAALQEAGLDYYVVGGWAFFAQQEIYDILNVVRAIENPHDAVPLAGALRSPMLQVSDEALAVLAQHPCGLTGGLYDSVLHSRLPPEQQEAVARAAHLLRNWQQCKDRLSLPRLLQRIIADTAYDAALQFEPLGQRKLANLWKIIELAREFEQADRFGLHEFADRLRDLVARQPREEQAATVPEQADVIRLMSIHQAKGLEFPVVFVPDLAGSRRGAHHPSVCWHRTLGALVDLPAEWKTEAAAGENPPFAPWPYRLGQRLDLLDGVAEEHRIFYVACTRAADRLILSAALERPPRAADLLLPLAHNPCTLLLEERFDPLTGACRDPRYPLTVQSRLVQATAGTTHPSTGQTPDAA